MWNWRCRGSCSRPSKREWCGESVEFATARSTFASSPPPIAIWSRRSARDHFRKDLYFRLAVILLRLPPLRERGNDVLLLADHYLKRFSAKYGRDVRRLDTASRQLLLAYPWPGNVRELSHVIERAVLWSQGPELTPEHLSLTQPGGAVAPGRNDETQPPAELATTETARAPEGLSLDQWEKSLLEQALRDTGGNQTKAAQRLGISRDTLRYRMKKHGIGG